MFLGAGQEEVLAYSVAQICWFGQSSPGFCSKTLTLLWVPMIHLIITGQIWGCGGGGDTLTHCLPFPTTSLLIPTPN